MNHLLNTASQSHGRDIPHSSAYITPNEMANHEQSVTIYYYTFPCSILEMRFMHSLSAYIIYIFLHTMA